MVEPWNQKDFDAGAWARGESPLGYGEDFIKTKLSFGDQSNKKPQSDPGSSDLAFDLEFGMESLPLDQLSQRVTVDMLEQQCGFFQRVIDLLEALPRVSSGGKRCGSCRVSVLCARTSD